jgi:hypothetical protein
VLVVGERHRAHHRPEDLLADDLHVGRGVDEHGRLDEVAAVAGAAAAGDRAGALLDPGVQVAAHARELLVGDQRAHLRVGVKAAAEPDLAGLLGHAGDHVVEHAGLDVQARARAAALAVVEEDRVRRAGDRDLEVGVVEHDLR